MSSKMRTTKTQFHILVDYMEKNGDITKIKPSVAGRAKMTKHWEEVAQLLNNTYLRQGSEGHLLIRTVDQWKKVWSDFKNNIRRKAGKIRQDGVYPGDKRFSLESRVLTILTQSPVECSDYSEVSDSDDENQIKIVQPDPETIDSKSLPQETAAKVLQIKASSSSVMDSDDWSSSSDVKEVKMDYSIENYIDHTPVATTPVIRNNSASINADINVTKDNYQVKSAKATVTSGEYKSCTEQNKTTIKIVNIKDLTDVGRVNDLSIKDNKRFWDNQFRPNAHNTHNVVDNIDSRCKEKDKVAKDSIQATSDIGNKAPTAEPNAVHKMPPIIERKSSKQMNHNKQINVPDKVKNNPTKAANEPGTKDGSAQMEANTSSKKDVAQNNVPNNKAETMKQIRPETENIDRPGPVKRRRVGHYSMMLENEKFLYEREIALRKLELEKEKLRVKGKSLALFEQLLTLAEAYLKSNMSQQ